MKICLNMIVKDEAPVIRRCLDSVKGLIDTWVIVDTGSSDGTQEIIKEALRGIPGELHERPWVNFAVNRNEALQLARGKAEYILFIDADDRLLFPEGFAMPSLDKEAYYVRQKLTHGTDFATFSDNYILFMIKDSLSEAKWEGPLHEILRFDASRTKGFFEDIVNEYLHDGNRSKDPGHIENDIAILKKAIEEEPKNGRHVFYLAQVLRGSGDFPQALKYYCKRIGMGGDRGEIFYSLFCKGLLQKLLGYTPDAVAMSLSKARSYRPWRAEPLYYLAQLFIEQKNYLLGYLMAKSALHMQQPQDIFVDSWVYEWGIKEQYALCAKEIGKAV